MRAQANVQNAHRSSLRLKPSVRSSAEKLSQQQGVSLSEFVTRAVAEKVAEIEFADRQKNRKPLRKEEIDWALGLLCRPGGLPPAPGDELPEGYESPFFKT